MLEILERDKFKFEFVTLWKRPCWRLAFHKTQLWLEFKICFNAKFIQKIKINMLWCVTLKLIWLSQREKKNWLTSYWHVIKWYWLRFSNYILGPYYLFEFLISSRYYIYLIYLKLIWDHFRMKTKIIFKPLI